MLGLLVALGACTEPKGPSLPDGQEGERCALAGERIRDCASGLTCRPSPIDLVAPTDRQSGGVVGEQCGGLAGVKCASGLACAWPARPHPDEMGSCRVESVCRL